MKEGLFIIFIRDLRVLCFSLLREEEREGAYSNYLFTIKVQVQQHRMRYGVKSHDDDDDDDEGDPVLNV